MNDFNINFDKISPSNLNSTVGSYVMEVLHKLGVEVIVTSPGSRSAPLTMSAIRNKNLETISILDERSASYFALGLAKSSKKPVVLICTSGTAAANYYPAIIESYYSSTPLIVLTADRSFDMRACNSGQTIDQLKLFGVFVNDFIDIGLPELNRNYFNYLRQNLTYSVNKCMRIIPGPIHLNFSFKDPLYPDVDYPLVPYNLFSGSLSFLSSHVLSESHWESLDENIFKSIISKKNGIIIVGACSYIDLEEEFIDSLSFISNSLGWPVLADALNPIRNHASCFNSLITNYDFFLNDNKNFSGIEPETILLFGGLPTSKRLRSWVKLIDANIFTLNKLGKNINSLHNSSIPINSNLKSLAKSLENININISKTWIHKWEQIESFAEKKIKSMLNKTDINFEGRIANIVSKSAPPNCSFFISNSMSVRYTESFWNKNNSNNEMYYNRGVNGIDGNISTAIGLAHNSKPVIMLCGDLAFIHDSNALLLNKILSGNITIILINNKGGGIFNQINDVEMPKFEEYFVTPQDVSLEKLINSHNISYKKLNNLDNLPSELNDLEKYRFRVLEINTDRINDKLTYKGFLNEKN